MPGEPAAAADTATVRAGLLERLATRLPVRVDPGRRGAVAIGIAVLVAAVVTGVWVLSSRPHAVAVNNSGSPPAASLTSASAASPTRGPASAPSSPTAAGSPVVLVVDVAGKVRHPGLYRLSAGSRVDDAVQAAGGPLPGVDLTSLNLAAKVTDGQQIAVGAPGAPPGGGASGGSAAAASSVAGPVDLNSATLEQLETLPGVGPVLGQHILDWRDAHGSFVTVDQLRDVSGIGDVKFAALRCPGDGMTLAAVPTASLMRTAVLDLRLAVGAGAAWLAVLIALARSPGRVLFVAGIAATMAVAVLTAASCGMRVPAALALVGFCVALALVPLAGRLAHYRASPLVHLAGEQASVTAELTVTADPRPIAAAGIAGLPGLPSRRPRCR